MYTYIYIYVYGIQFLGAFNEISSSFCFLVLEKKSGKTEFIMSFELRRQHDLQFLKVFCVFFWVLFPATSFPAISFLVIILSQLRPHTRAYACMHTRENTQLRVHAIAHICTHTIGTS